MSVVTGRREIHVPEVFVNTHELRAPHSMMIAGEAADAHAVTEVYDYLNELTLWRSGVTFHTSGTGLFALTLPHVRDAARIEQDHRRNLTAGYGLQEGQSTEALFVGPRKKEVSREAAVWIGRALSSPHIERTYYLDFTGSHAGIAQVEGLTSPDSGLTVITDPIDVFTLVPKGGGPEIRYSDARNLNRNQVGR